MMKISRFFKNEMIVIGIRNLGRYPFIIGIYYSTKRRSQTLKDASELRLEIYRNEILCCEFYKLFLLFLQRKYEHIFSLSSLIKRSSRSSSFGLPALKNTKCQDGIFGCDSLFFRMFREIFIDLFIV